MKKTPNFPTIFAIIFSLMLSGAGAQLADDSHWFYEYGGPSSEPFGLEFAGDYAYVYGGFLRVDGDDNMKNLTRFHLKRERFERVPGIDRNFSNFIRDAHADNEGNLFISGDFSSVNGITARRVARFDLATETWHALQDPTLPDSDRYGPSSGNGYAVVRSGDYVYLGGFLFDHPDQGQKFVRRFNLVTNRWEAVGNGLNDVVRDFAVDSNGDVYAGGGFTATGDGATTLNHLAKWNGSSWTSVGGGVSGAGVSTIIRSMDIDSNDRLAVGGRFGTAGTGGGQVTCGDVAVWRSGSGWNNLDGGITPEAGESVFGVWGLSFSSDGKLYIGGDFSFNATQTVELNKVAFYENGQWNPMGSGLGRSSSQIVNGVRCNGCDAFFVGVYARGWTSPNSQPNFARWNSGENSDDYVPGTPWVNCTLEILPSTSNPGNFAMEHGSNAGQTYTIESSTDLTDWEPISQPFQATTDNGVIWGSLPPAGLRRFWRVAVSE